MLCLPSYHNISPLPCLLYQQGDSDDKIAKMGINMWGGALLFFIWLGILIPVLVLVRVLPYDHKTEDTPLDWFEVFYRTGSIIYGGGQVRCWRSTAIRYCSGILLSQGQGNFSDWFELVECAGFHACDGGKDKAATSRRARCACATTARG